MGAPAKVQIEEELKRVNELKDLVDLELKIVNINTLGMNGKKNKA